MSPNAQSRQRAGERRPFARGRRARGALGGRAGPIPGKAPLHPVATRRRTRDRRAPTGWPRRFGARSNPPEGAWHRPVARHQCRRRSRAPCRRATPRTARPPRLPARIRRAKTESAHSPVAGRRPTRPGRAPRRIPMRAAQRGGDQEDVADDRGEESWSFRMPAGSSRPLRSRWAASLRFHRPGGSEDLRDLWVALLPSAFERGVPESVLPTSTFPLAAVTERVVPPFAPMSRAFPRRREAYVLRPEPPSVPRDRPPRQRGGR